MELHGPPVKIPAWPMQGLRLDPERTHGPRSCALPPPCGHTVATSLRRGELALRVVRRSLQLLVCVSVRREQLEGVRPQLLLQPLAHSGLPRFLCLEHTVAGSEDLVLPGCV